MAPTGSPLVYPGQKAARVYLFAAGAAKYPPAGFTKWHSPRYTLRLPQ